MTAPASLAQDEAFARIRLLRSPHVGPISYAQLLRRFGNARAALEALPDLAARGGRDYRPAQGERIEQEVAAVRAAGARYLFHDAPGYPDLLGRAEGAPPILIVRGDPQLAAGPCVAVVGARNASAAAVKLARDFARALAGEGFVVVSGLARGIDGAAHEGALETGTVAVLGGGVDDIYPPEHADLYARIVERGCVVSESPMGHRAQAKDFPRRNRIISGLSLGVVVVEAEIRSGSLITARLAAEQGREVFAIPGSPLDPRSKGPNMLIRQGAALVESVDDVREALAGPRRLAEPEPPPFLSDEDVDAGLLERVAGLLSATPTPRDELARAAAAPIGAVAAALLELSLAGRAELLPGGLVVRID